MRDHHQGCEEDSGCAASPCFFDRVPTEAKLPYLANGDAHNRDTSCCQHLKYALESFQVMSRLSAPPRPSAYQRIDSYWHNVFVPFIDASQIQASSLQCSIERHVY